MPWKQLWNVTIGTHNASSSAFKGLEHHDLLRVYPTMEMILKDLRIHHKNSFETPTDPAQLKTLADRYMDSLGNAMSIASVNGKVYHSPSPQTPGAPAVKHLGAAQAALSPGGDGKSRVTIDQLVCPPEVNSNQAAKAMYNVLIGIARQVADLQGQHKDFNDYTLAKFNSSSRQSKSKKICWESIDKNRCGHNRECSDACRGSYGINPMTLLLRLTNHSGRANPLPVTTVLITRYISFAQKFLDLWTGNHDKGIKPSSVNPPNLNSTRTSPNPRNNSTSTNRSAGHNVQNDVFICGPCLHPGVTPIISDCPKGHCLWYHKPSESCFCQRSAFMQRANDTRKSHANFVVCDGTLPPDQCHANRQVTEQARGTLARAAAFNMIDVPSQTATVVAQTASGLDLETRQFIYDCVTGAVTTRPN